MNKRSNKNVILTDAESNDIEKINTCFEHIKMVYDNQIIRFRELDSKASLLLNTVSAIVALILLSFAYLFGKDSFINNNIFIVIATLSCGISLIILFITGWNAIRAFHCISLNDVANPRDILDLYITDYKDTTVVKIKEDLAFSYCEAIDSYQDANIKKAKCVKFAQSCLKSSLLFLLIFIFTLMSASYFHEGGDIMDKHNNDKEIQKTERPSDKLRNPKIRPMQVFGRRGALVERSPQAQKSSPHSEKASKSNTIKENMSTKASINTKVNSKSNQNQK